MRDDALGRMYARRQIDKPQYLAGRAYQETADRATLGSVKSIDLAKTRVSGGAVPETLTEASKERWRGCVQSSSGSRIATGSRA